ncbi:MAG: MerR family transcriptional regulator [Chloroflexi bacterium]|nr:MerR family transcriptional regulator [Chloroflexota bacterium]
MFKIGEFSKLSQVPVKTLRYYDEIGLLKPAKVDRFTAYRYYSADQLPRLNRILALKDLGLSLAQIGRLLDGDLPPAQMRGMLRLKQVELQERVQEEQARLARVEARLRQIEKEGTMPTYEVVLRKVEPQTVVAIRDTIPTFSDQGALWKEMSDYLEQQGAKAAGPSLTIYHDTEYREQDVDVEVTTPVSAPPPASERVTVRELPGAEQMACVIHQGSYETIGEAYNALMAWIGAHGYNIVGPSREVYLRCPDNEYTDAEAVGYAEYVANDPAAFVTEVQFPVQKA